MVQLLPPRGLVPDVRLHRPVRLLVGGQLAPKTSPRAEQVHPHPAPRAGQANPGRGDRHVPPRDGGDRRLPIPGHSHPHPMVASRDARNTRTSGMNTWRAGCGDESHVRFGGWAAEPTGRKTGRALRSDPYTEHPTREGKLYCCVVLDVCSRKVVGWAIDSRQRADLATSALGMAIDSSGTAGQTSDAIIHADHGTRSGRACRLSSRPAALADTDRTRERSFRVHRRVLRPPPPTLRPELDEPDTVRNHHPNAESDLLTGESVKPGQHQCPCSGGSSKLSRRPGGWPPRLRSGWFSR